MSDSAMQGLTDLPGDYLHDVFISLPHLGRFVRWAEEIFVPMLKEELAEELGVSEGSVSIYLAKERMKPGDAWPTRLAQNLARSRTLFALCTNCYQHKDWCQIEFSMMRAREERCGYRTNKNPGSLLVPAIGKDCEDGPPYLTGIEPIDIRDYTYPELPSRCAELVELRKRTEMIASSLAAGIQNCPPFDQTWEVLTCDGFLELFRKHNVNRSQSRPPRMDGE